MYRIIFLILAFSIKLDAAVHLSNSGTGQAVIIPFYTVANGLNTLITINNTKQTPKAVKVHIRESKKGNSLYSFNLYLDGNDIWAAGLIQIDDQIKLLTNDQSCALSLIDPDIQNTDLVWETGLIEIIEMGEISKEDTDFFDFHESNDERCGLFNSAWEGNGTNINWSSNSETAMMSASGGIVAEASIIDVEQGFAFPVPSITLEGFYPVGSIHHTSPESHTPDLSSGTHDSLILNDGLVINTTWPTGYEAVSALFTKETLENQFDINPSIGAFTEWVVSFPTLRYYLNHENTTKPFVITEFEQVYYLKFPTDLGHMIFDREGNRKYYQCGITCPNLSESELNHTVNVFLIDQRTTNGDITVVLADENANNIVGVSDLVGYASQTTEGKMLLRFPPTSPYSLVNDNGVNTITEQAQQYHGLPVVGFSFIRYKNANAQPGVLATYATSQAHYGVRKVIE